MEELTREDIIKREARKKRVQIIALSITAFFVVVGIILWNNADKIVNYEHTLAMSAKTVNLVCPTMVDDDTRLDSVTTKPGRNYIYHYTALNLDRTELDIETTCEFMKEAILENMVGDANMAEFGRHKVTIVFNFNDKNSLELCSIRVLPEEYYPKRKKGSPDSLKMSPVRNPFP